MRNLTLTASLIAASLSTAALAEYWLPVTSSRSGDFIFIDRDTMRTQSDGYKRAWVMVVMAKPNASGDTHSKTYHEFDCRERRERYLQLTFFKGSTVSSSFTPPGDWIYTSPGSVADGTLHFACFGKLPD